MVDRTTLGDDYDVVVVGSGFGGAVAACRLAQADQRVAVLERGRRYGRGGFPRGWGDRWLWQTQGGPFDIRPFGELTTIGAAGYGGGSLLYSNVHLRVPADGFSLGWPTGWDRPSLDPYYDLVAHMLDLSPIDASQPLGLPQRTQRMCEAAHLLDRQDAFFLPTLAVNFGPPDVPAQNRYHRTQAGCSHCGECSIGCNTQAKNSLDLNYLAQAEDQGAEVGMSCEVVGLRPTGQGPAGEGYTVTYVDHEHGVEREIRARTVVLAAGAVNTTELLLRCRDQFATLPRLSERLGERYSANGDLLAFALGTDRPFEPTAGPAITCAVLHAEGATRDDPWFLLQDGGIPPQFAAVALQGLRGADWFEDWAGGLLPLGEGEWVDRLWQLAGEEGEEDPARCAVFLAMGRDSSDGVLRLLDLPGRPAWLEWDVAGNRDLYEIEQRLSEEFASALGADPVSNPSWRFLRLPVSVHNLGGAVMADTAAEGVVDPHGEVHGYPGLHVLDGAALPRATGVNPSHTIAAMAERNVEHLVRRLRGEPGWRAPERSVARPVEDPLPPTPPGGSPPPRRVSTGVRSRVSLRGALALVDGGGTVRLSCDGLELLVPSVREILRPPGNVASARGTLVLEGPWGDGPPEDRPSRCRPSGDARVGTGLVALGRRARWTLPFESGDDTFVLEGWSTGRTLRLALRSGPRPTSPVLAVGVAVLDVVPTLLRTRLVGRPVRRASAAVRRAVGTVGSGRKLTPAPGTTP